MSASDRRIAALRRTTTRRKRMEDELRGTLAKQREEQAQIAARCDEKSAGIEREHDVLKESQTRIAQMMTGSEAFSIGDMHASMRYADTVSDRIHVLERERNSLEQAHREKTHEIAKTVRAIANNRGRIDLCNRRIEVIKRALDNEASDAADEDAEEASLARHRHAATSDGRRQ
jgi:type III secretion system HrpB7-like protein